MEQKNKTLPVVPDTMISILFEMAPILKLCGLEYEIKFSNRTNELMVDATAAFLEDVYNKEYKDAKYARGLVSEKQWQLYELYYGDDCSTFQEVMLWTNAKNALIAAFKDRRPATIKKVKANAE